MKKNAVLLLDLDGVVNADRAMEVWGDDRAKIVHPDGEGTGYWFTWSPTLLRELQELPVELRLCSTWCENPKAILPVIGLDIPSAFEPSCSPMSYFGVCRAKEMSALGVLADGRPLVWIDDEAIPTAWEMPGSVDGEYLTVVPDYRFGITPQHVADIRKWLAD